MDETPIRAREHRMAGRPGPARRRVTSRVAMLVVAVGAITVLVAGCGTSSNVTASSSTTSSDAGTTIESSGKQAGSATAIAGTWTSVDGDKARFCTVEGPPGAGDAPPPTSASGCAIDVDWGVVNRLVIGSDGKMTMTFAYQGAGHASSGEPGDAVHDGSCEATATIDGTRMQLAAVVCKPMAGDGNSIDGSGLAHPTWKLEGVCLRIDDSWFEQTKRTCIDQQAEQKFNDVGNAIANAS